MGKSKTAYGNIIFSEFGVTKITSIENYNRQIRDANLVKIFNGTIDEAYEWVCKYYCYETEQSNDEKQ